MIAPVVLLLISAAWAAWLVRRYRNTGEASYMSSAGTVVMAGSFVTACFTVFFSPIYPERLVWALVVVLAGAVIGSFFNSFAYKGWRKLSAALRGFGFLGFSLFVVTSLPGHAAHRPMRLNHGERECAKIVPGSSKGDIDRLDRAGREALAARLGEALSSSDDFVRLGALRKLSYMPEEAGPAVPAMAPLIANIDINDEVSRELIRLLTMMGPAAAAAIPDMEAKIASLAPHRNYDLERALEAVRPPGQQPAP